MPVTPDNKPFSFENTYIHLPEAFYARLDPEPVRESVMQLWNTELAAALGITLTPGEATAYFSGNMVPPGAAPIAQAYAGHQFGHLNMLGDGRALLLGEHLTPDGQRVDIQLKGSGRTPFSRSGDGRAALGPMIREYIISEAMYALGIPTTRSLAVVTTGERVQREMPLPGAILTRIAASHIRVGTFEYAVRLGDLDLLRALADHSIKRHDPELEAGDYSGFLKQVIERQAKLIAQWMLVGFVHGVMNTDNMAISGETIDYGPCAFMDRYDAATVFSSIDIQGRYAYGRQPAIAHWNLTRFAETLVPLLHTETAPAIAIAEEAINAFPAIYHRYWLEGMRAKLGLANAAEGDESLAVSLLGYLQQHRQDYTNSFLDLTDGTHSHWHGDAAEWLSRWNARRQNQPGGMQAAEALMRAHNPRVIPRNHRVEEAIEAAVEQQDLTAAYALLRVLHAPFSDTEESRAYREMGADTGYRTFCGT